VKKPLTTTEQGSDPDKPELPSGRVRGPAMDRTGASNPRGFDDRTKERAKKKKTHALSLSLCLSVSLSLSLSQNDARCAAAAAAADS